MDKVIALISKLDYPEQAGLLKSVLISLTGRVAAGQPIDDAVRYELELVKEVVRKLLGCSAEQYQDLGKKFLQLDVC